MAERTYDKAEQYEFALHEIIELMNEFTGSQPGRRQSRAQVMRDVTAAVQLVKPFRRDLART